MKIIDIIKEYNSKTGMPIRDKDETGSKRTHPNQLYHATDMYTALKIMKSKMILTVTSDEEEYTKYIGKGWENHPKFGKVWQQRWNKNKSTPPHVSAGIDELFQFNPDVQFVLNISALKEAGFIVEKYDHHWYGEIGEEIIYHPKGYNIPINNSIILRIEYSNKKFNETNLKLKQLKQFAKSIKIPVVPMNIDPKDIRHKSDDSLPHTKDWYMQNSNQLFLGKVKNHGSYVIAADISKLTNGSVKSLILDFGQSMTKKDQWGSRLQDLSLKFPTNLELAKERLNQLKTDPKAFSELKNAMKGEEIIIGFDTSTLDAPIAKVY